MYCDWATRGELDRNPGAWLLLKQIGTKLQTSASNTDIGVVAKEISEGLSLVLLRSDFVGLFNEKGIDTSLFTVQENWIMFRTHHLYLSRYGSKHLTHLSYKEACNIDIKPGTQHHER